MSRTLMGLLAALFLALLAPRSAVADDLDEVRSSGKLIWGADQEGGGPYVYPRDDDPQQVTGFEYDLAAALADYLKVKPEFFQDAWDAMPSALNTKRIHIMMNGYEWTPERIASLEPSIPYYVYSLQLLVRKDDLSIQSWEDLCKPFPDGGLRKVGVLGGSGAAEYMHENYEGKCDVIDYDGNTDSMKEVENGKLDGTLQDTPIASFYAPSFPNLRPVGEPVTEGYYVLYARKGETRLIAKLNEALIFLLRTGELEKIYRKYGIWDIRQEKLFAISDGAKFFGYNDVATVAVTKGEMPTEDKVQRSVKKQGWSVVTEYSGTLASAASITVILAVCSFPLAVLIGMTVAIGRLYGPVWLRYPLAAYVEFLRGTPLIVQLYFIFYFLPEIGILVPAFAAGVMGLAINYSAYESEIYRAGLQSIPPGQMEAAESLGMSRVLALRRIIVPQAFKIVIPPVMNDFIALFKDTSVCSVITVVELAKRFSMLSMSTQATVELMAMTCVLYMAMSYPLSLVSAQIERRLGVGGVR